MLAMNVGSSSVRADRKSVLAAKTYNGRLRRRNTGAINGPGLTFAVEFPIASGFGERALVGTAAKTALRWPRNVRH
jgi:hypothetical protein